jgi:hypothetical protein
VGKEPEPGAVKCTKITRLRNTAKFNVEDNQKSENLYYLDFYSLISSLKLGFRSWRLPAPRHPAPRLPAPRLPAPRLPAPKAQKIGRFVNKLFSYVPRVIKKYMLSLTRAIIYLQGVWGFGSRPPGSGSETLIKTSVLEPRNFSAFYGSRLRLLTH